MVESWCLVYQTVTVDVLPLLEESADETWDIFIMKVDHNFQPNFFSNKPFLLNFDVLERSGFVLWENKYKKNRTLFPHVHCQRWSKISDPRFGRVDQVFQSLSENSYRNNTFPTIIISNSQNVFYKASLYQFSRWLKHHFEISALKSNEPFTTFYRLVTLTRESLVVCKWSEHTRMPCVRHSVTLISIPAAPDSISG